MLTKNQQPVKCVVVVVVAGQTDRQTDSLIEGGFGGKDVGREMLLPLTTLGA